MSIKTAILGYGRNGSTMHGNELFDNNNFDVTAICDIDENAMKRGMERYNCEGYSDYKEMLEKANVEFVAIVTKSYQHSAMAIDCLNSGKNVLVTKPWALNKTEATDMIQAAKNSGKKLMPWLPARYGYDLSTLKSILQQNLIGDVFRVQRRNSAFNIRSDWQVDKSQGGGYLLNWGPHIVDQPMQLIGAKAKSVYAEMGHLVNLGDAEDYFHAVIKTDKGITINAEFTFAQKDNFFDWVICGNKGTITVKGANIEIFAGTYPTKKSEAYGEPIPYSKITVEAPQGADCYGNSHTVYEHIAKTIKGEEEYFVNLESAYHLTEVLDAIRESADKNEVIKL